MIELGKYAFPVLMSYGFAIISILTLVIFSVTKQRKIRTEIKKLEE